MALIAADTRVGLGVLADNLINMGRIKRKRPAP
jgi:hypothetical protein